MAFRFQKRIKLMPGVTVNLSRKGVSTSLGVTGARVTLGHGQQRTTVGLPGSGISYTSIATPDKGPPSAPEPVNKATADIPTTRKPSVLRRVFFTIGKVIGRMMR